MRSAGGEAAAHAQLARASGGAVRRAMAGGGGGAVRAAVAAVLLAAWGAHGLYFHIGETEKRCFIEEIPDETMVIGEGGGGGGGGHRERYREVPAGTGAGSGGPPGKAAGGEGEERPSGSGEGAGGDGTGGCDGARCELPVPPQGTTGRSCGTSSRSRSCPPPRGWACTWR